MIRQAEREFSRIRRLALENEWRSAFPSLPSLLDYLKVLRSPAFNFTDLCDQQAVQELALPLTENRIDFDPMHEVANRLFAGDATPEDFMRDVIGILYRVGAVGVKP